MLRRNCARQLATMRGCEIKGLRWHDVNFLAKDADDPKEQKPILVSI
jgi:hypothetical protein